MRARYPTWTCLALLTAALAGCGGKDKPADAAAPAMAVTLAAAQTRPMARAVVVSGPVSAFEEMQLGVEVSGQRVTSLRVDVGQWVKRGDILLQLDHRTLDSELAQAQAALRQATELRRAQQASFFPTVDASYSASRQKVARPLASPLASNADLFNLSTAQLSVSYTPSP